jgi:tRNA pseudouridine55 synthase
VLLGADKAYRAHMRFGESTTTGDSEGEVINRSAVSVDFEQIVSIVGQFHGKIMQIPPMYSALKHHGRPLYELAREGKSIERKPREVCVYSIKVVQLIESECIIDVVCSKGTYIRTLSEDIGSALGCGAHLIGLQRTAIGKFHISRALTLDNLEKLHDTAKDEQLLPLDAMLDIYSKTVLQTQTAARFLLGQAVELKSIEPSKTITNVAVYDAAGKFLGVGEADSEGWLRPRRLLKT